MNYREPREATLIRRKNRFVAEVLVDDEIMGVHVPNTGRCKELFVKGRRAILERGKGCGRKYPYSLVAIEKPGQGFVNIHSAMANDLVEEGIKEGKIVLRGLRSYRREATYGDCRFDFFVDTEEGTGYLEVKGVTLERGGVAAFPDAPTVRGARHLEELTALAREGQRAFVIFLIQMEQVHLFRPNASMDPHFAEALRQAQIAGVKVRAYSCTSDEVGISVKEEIPVDFAGSLSLRKATAADEEAILRLYENGRAILRRRNIPQWQGEYPGRNDFLKDLERGALYVGERDGDVEAVASLILGEEPTYQVIDGAWGWEAPYGTIHRMTVDSAHSDTAREMEALLEEEARLLGVHGLRIDTHEENLPMRRLIEKRRYIERGIITVADGTPRIAYDKEVCR